MFLWFNRRTGRGRRRRRPGPCRSSPPSAPIGPWGTCPRWREGTAGRYLTMRCDNQRKQEMIVRAGGGGGGRRRIRKSGKKRLMGASVLICVACHNNHLTAFDDASFRGNRDGGDALNKTMRRGGGGGGGCSKVSRNASFPPCRNLLHDRHHQHHCHHQRRPTKFTMISYT